MTTHRGLKFLAVPKLPRCRPPPVWRQPQFRLSLQPLYHHSHVSPMFGTDSLQAAASGPGPGINVYGVSIRWQSTDRISSSTSTTTFSSSGTSTPTPKPTMSTGAKAGIAVGVVFFALITILCIAFFATNRRRAASSSASVKENTTELQNAWLGLNKPELAATESNAMLPKELPDNQILEAGQNRGHFMNWNNASLYSSTFSIRDSRVNRERPVPHARNQLHVASYYKVRPPGSTIEKFSPIKIISGVFSISRVAGWSL